MRQRPFKQLDVFTATAYMGNPLAVVLDGSDLSEAQMRQFARWTNLSETTFLLPPTTPQADYRVRIFTPGTEYPFAGHPTLGSCHAWLEAGGQPRGGDTVVQECGIGLVTLRRSGQRLAFAAPPSRRSSPAPQALAQVAQALGLKSAQIRTAQLLDNGPLFMTLLLNEQADVLACKPDLHALAALKTCAALVSVHGDPAHPHIEVRAFGPHLGFDEDPVTGALNASLAQWLIEDGIAPPRYVATQGTCVGRSGQVHIERDAAGVIWVGGDSVTCIEGTVAF